MTERFRTCERCEWCDVDDAALSDEVYCMYAPESHEKRKNDFCSKWEPMWADNPKIKKQWEKFKTSIALYM